MRTTHSLKIWPEYFEQVRNGRMKFQLRRNDRDYKVGDHLLLKEWDPYEAKSAADAGRPSQAYTGREVLVRVDYIMVAPDFGDLISPIAPDFVIMSISHVN